jgi:hypothetical protein
MPTNVDIGITPVPDGGDVHWSRDDLTVAEGLAVRW